jgi:hypothetical protein
MKTTDIIVIGAILGIVYFSTKKPDTNNQLPGGGGTGAGSGGSGSGSGGTQTNTFNPNDWAASFKQYAVPACYTNCNNRYSILEQMQDKLSDPQLVQVSNSLKNLYGKTLFEFMSDMSWFGGPYFNNKATLLYNRVQNL